MRRIGLALFWVLVGVSLIGMAVGEGLPFKVIASPKFGFARGALTVKIIVPRKPEHRHLAVAVDCDGFYRSWQEVIHGEDGPGVFDEMFESMPAGHCDVRATLYKIDPKVASGVSSRTVRDRACFAGMGVLCGE